MPPRKNALLILHAKTRSGAELLESARQRLEERSIQLVHRDRASRGGLSPTIDREGRNVGLAAAVAGGDRTKQGSASFPE